MSKELVLQLHDLWSTGDLSRMEEIYSPEFVGHWPPGSETPTRQGFEGIEYGVNRIRTAFPDWHEHVMDIFGVGDKWTTRYHSTGTHKGPFWGIAPTGKKIEILEISIYKVENNLITEQWCMCDEIGRLKQIGITDLKDTC